MREILFKGKTIEDGKWIEGSLIIDEKENYYIGKYIESKGECSYYCTNRRNGKSLNRFIGVGFAMVDKETVCEYTQLKDKNGKRIWENDICRFREWSKGDMCWVGKVHYEHCQFVISGNPNKECESPFLLVMSRFIPENIEVIGNIFDNSELLEER